LDLNGYVDSINEAVISIALGRKGFAIIGKEREGRISYEDGIAKAMTVFIEAQTTDDPQVPILTEYTFITQEYQLCDKSDTDTLNSLIKAIESFDDAFLALKAVKDSPLYRGTELTFPHNGKYRVSGYPKDSFHIACIAHKTRLKNILRTPGLDPIEKDLLKQRLVNLSAAQNQYIEKQKKALTDL